MRPKIKIRGQYVKDLSFENPNAPRIFLMISNTPPDINITVNVSSTSLPVKPSGEEQQSSMELYEVVLQVNIESVVDKVSAFVCEMKYCGVFSIEEEAEREMIKEALLISAPTYLFPYVRELISRITSTAGFPPLMLEIIDFEQMYQQQGKDDAVQARDGEASA